MLTVINPATEAVLEYLEEDTVETIAHRVQRTKIAQQDWQRRSLRERLEIIRRFNEQLHERAETLAQQLTLETGKPIRQARAEVGATSSRIGFFLDQVDAMTATEVLVNNVEAGLTEQISHEPLGVIANISAWSYPYFLGTNVFIPALLTGNGVVYKPSEYAALTGRAIAELMVAAGVPPDVFQLLTGSGWAGAALLHHPLNGLFFTGSYATGCKVALAAAQHLMKVQLELGGKNPVYIADDVDIEATAATVADGAFYNTGQSCSAVERIYVHEQIYEPFVEAFLHNVKAFHTGDPLNDQTYIGPLARRTQLNVLHQQVNDALEKGATLLCGGDRLACPGYFFEPTVLVDVNHFMTLMRDESFGPVIGIQKVRNDQDAIALMGDTPYGLTAGVYTAERARATRILQQMNTGTVYWNCCDRVSPRLPWSGRGHSGIGLTLSTYGIQTFTQPKAWHLKTSVT